MEALLIPEIIPFGQHQMEGMMCCSPLSTFGDDFTLILRENTQTQQNEIREGKTEKSMELLAEDSEKEKTKPFALTDDTFMRSKENTATEDKEVKMHPEKKYTKKSKIPDDISEKYGCQPHKTPRKREKLEKKRKKWKPLSNEEMGFKVSLFPRPVSDNINIDADAAKLFDKIESECDERESFTVKFEKFQCMEGSCKNIKVVIRADRDRKVEKAYKQVKTKYCLSVKNNNGRKHLHINHRVYKLMIMEITTSLNYIPSKKKEKIIISRELKKITTSSSKQKSSRPDVIAPRPPPQNLAFALDNNNAASDIDSAIVNILIGLQHRDLTPEDYELLLRLDEQVAPKTVSSNTVENFKTETIDADVAGELCAICMEVYEIGQTRKFLPCDHAFHSKCIEMWLSNSSVNCPIDNLPVEPS